MDGAISIKDSRIEGGAARISETVTCGPVGIVYGGRPDLDHEFPFCRSSVRKFRRGEVIAGAGVVIDMEVGYLAGVFVSGFVRRSARQRQNNSVADNVAPTRERQQS